MNIREKKDNFDVAMNQLHEDIEKLQQICSHKNADKTPRSDTDDYDRGYNVRYWYECKCRDCDKYWEEPQ